MEILLASPCPLILSSFTVAGKYTADEGALEVHLNFAVDIRYQGFIAFLIAFYLETMKDHLHRIPSHIGYIDSISSISPRVPFKLEVFVPERVSWQSFLSLQSLHQIL